jgi:hypothetical protein
VRSTTFVFKALCTCIQKMELFTFKPVLSKMKCARAPSRRLGVRAHTSRLGVCARTAPEASTPPEPRPRRPRRPSRARGLPRRMRPEAPLFLPTPCVTHRPRRARTPSRPPVCLRPLAPTDAAVVLRPHLHRHRVVTGERAPYLRSSTPLTRAPSRRRSSRSTASAIAGRQ